MPFVLQKIKGKNKQELLEAAKKTQDFINKRFKSEDARNLFVDLIPAINSLPEGTLTEEQLAAAHIAINDPLIMFPSHDLTISFPIS